MVEKSAMGKSLDRSSHMTSSDNGLVIRNAALELLSQGHPPSTLGTILPSLHPGYLHALFLGPMSNVRAFLEPSVSQIDHRSNDVDVSDNQYVIYFDEWSIDGIVNQVGQISQPGAATDIANGADCLQPSPGDCKTFSNQAEAIKRVQARISRKLCNLRFKCFCWRHYDALQEHYDEEAVEAVVNDPLVKQAGALQNLETYWRTRLGWVQSEPGYWLDSASLALNTCKFRFVAYSPDELLTKGKRTASTSVSIPDMDQDMDTNAGERYTKYFWSNVSGGWKTASGLAQERQKIHRDRNAWLVKEIAQIEREQQEGLAMEHVELALPYLGDCPKSKRSRQQFESSGIFPQKVAKKRKVKKQVPERRFGSVEFIPEDNQLCPLDDLAVAATTTTTTRIEASGPLGDIVDGKKTMQTVQQLEEAVEQEKTDFGRLDIDPSPDPSIDVPKHGSTQALSLSQMSKNTQTERPSKQRKSIEPKAEPKAAPVVGIRQSSRLAANEKKRKEDCNSEKKPVTTGEPSRKQSSVIDWGVRKDYRTVPLPIESRQDRFTKFPSEIPDIDELTMLGSPAAMFNPPSIETTLKNEIINTEKCAVDFPNGSRSQPNDPASLTTNFSLQATPQRLTTMTLVRTVGIPLDTSPLLTAAARADLMSSYPFLLSLSDVTQELSTTSSCSASVLNLEPAAANLMNGDRQDTDETEDEKEGEEKSRLTEWLEFLHFFGRHESVRDRLNQFFEQGGAVDREEEFLECLKHAVGKISRADEDDPVNGEARYVYQD